MIKVMAEWRTTFFQVKIFISFVEVWLLLSVQLVPVLMYIIQSFLKFTILEEWIGPNK